MMADGPPIQIKVGLTISERHEIVELRSIIANLELDKVSANFPRSWEQALMHRYWHLSKRLSVGDMTNEIVQSLVKP